VHNLRFGQPKDTALELIESPQFFLESVLYAQSVEVDLIKRFDKLLD
jgi:hypothetical protein